MTERNHQDRIGMDAPLASFRDHLVTTLDSLSRDGRGPMLLSMAIAWLLAFGMRAVIPTLFPQIKDTFAVNNTLLGLTFSLFTAATAIVPFPAGVITDRIGERYVLVISVVLASVSLLLVAIAPVFFVFMGAVLLFGLSVGLYGPPRATLLSRVYQNWEGTALGITFAAGSLGAATLPIVAGFAVTRLGWRGIIWTSIPLFALASIGLWVFLPRTRDPSTSASRSSFRRIVAGTTRRPILFASGAFSFVVFAFQGITAFLPTYLIVEKGFSQPLAATVFGLFYAAGVFAQPLAGNVADLYGKRVTLVTVTLCFSVGLLALPHVEGALPLAVLAVLLRTAHGGTVPITTSYIVTALPEDMKGSGYGLVRTFYLGLGSTGAVFVGWFADAELFDSAFVVLGAAAAVATGLYLLLPRNEIDADASR